MTNPIPQNELIALAKGDIRNCNCGAQSQAETTIINRQEYEQMKADAERMKDYTKDLNRRVEVEQVLLNVSADKRGPLTPEECKALALKLGVPDWFRERVK